MPAAVCGGMVPSEVSMPRYKFKWTNLDDSLLRGLCRDLGLGVAEPAKTLTYNYGARPTDDFVRETWPSLRDRWLAKDPLSRGSVVDALWSLGLGEGEPPAHKAEQMSFLLGRNNARRLREVVLKAFIALGETTTVDANPTVATPTATAGRTRRAGPTKSHNNGEPKVPPKIKKQESVGLEVALWDAANQLRSNMDAAEYKHVVLGLIFLKYVSDVFASRHETLAAAVADTDSDYFMPTESARRATLEDRDEYTSEGVFWIPEGHRWDDLRLSLIHISEP